MFKSCNNQLIIIDIGKKKKVVKLLARKRLITRSIKSTECECLCLDTKENETFNMTVNISGDFKNSTDMLMRAKELTETEDVILCTILETKEVVKRYWLEEDEFIKVANIFPEKQEKEKEVEHV